MIALRPLVVIPARFASSRFPGKPLALIHGVPLVLRVAERARAAVGLESVVVATESPRIAEVVEAAGYRCVMTADSHVTGTDRVAEVASQIESEFIINVQGDEPLIDPSDILAVIAAKREHPSDVICGMSTIPRQQALSTSVPKVVHAADGRLIYFSRSLVPGAKSEDVPRVFKRQVCIYAFSKEELQLYAKAGRVSALEQAEDIELLRYLEMGHGIRMVEVSGGSVAVDHPEDILEVERLLALTKP